MLQMGVGMAAMNAMAPQFAGMMQGFGGQSQTQEPLEPKKDGWTCATCGKTYITSKFCPDCGAPKPTPNTWDCANCGCKGISSKFCPDCGAPKPTPPSTWTCPDCGTANITSKFCPECGRKKGE